MDNFYDWPIAANDNVPEFLLGHNSRQGPVRLDARALNGMGEVSANQFGADPTGSRDSTAAFLAAVDYLGSNRGRITARPGKYRVQGLPLKSGLYYDFSGQGAILGTNGTYLSLPSAPTSSPMFLPSPDGNGDLYGSGIRGAYCAGGQNKATATIDFIDGTTITGQMHQLTLDDVWMDGWRRCYNGSTNDRSVIARGCHFWNSTVGLYIVNNHPKLSEWNDFRSCTYGIQASMTDAFIANQQFVLCDYGVAPRSAGSVITETTFNNCTFFQNNNEDLNIHSHNIITGCQFLPKQAGTPNALRVCGNGNSVVGSHFKNGSSGTGTYTLGFIVADGDANTTSPSGLNVSGNFFNILNNNILYHLASASSRDIVNWNITGNLFVDPGKFYSRASANGAMFGCNISSNTFRLETTNIGAGVDLIAITNANTVGNVYNANMFYAFAGTVLRYAIGGDLTQSVVQGNYIRRTSGIDPAAAASAAISNNIWQP